METATFHDILIQKMGNESPSETLHEKTRNAFQQSVSSISDSLFFIHVEGPRVNLRQAYPPPLKKTKSPSENGSKASPLEAKKNIVFRVKKQDLDPSGQSKWARFEKMVGQNFGDSVSETEVLKSFRVHLKAHHPDLNGGKSGDFALMVRVKNELIQVLKQNSPE